MDKQINCSCGITNVMKLMENPGGVTICLLSTGGGGAMQQ